MSNRNDPELRPDAERGEEFLSRWSRLKRESREQAEVPAPVAPAVDPAEPPPDLPPVDTLTADSDFRDFLHPGVDPGLRRAALKKLFSNPHFNIMDGLDVYIDDYSVPNPLPAAMLAQLKQAQNIIEWAKEKPGEKVEREHAPHPDETPAPALEGETGDATAAAMGSSASVTEPQPARNAPGPDPAGDKAADDGGMNT